MIERLCRVIGVEYPEDPDESYVLTADNLLKMMAIHMRFRYVSIIKYKLYLTIGIVIIHHKRRFHLLLLAGSLASFTSNLEI